MAICYKKLWKCLDERKLKKKDLSELSGVSLGTLSKMRKCGIVKTSVLEKICLALNCDVGDILEIVPDCDEKKEK